MIEVPSFRGDMYYRSNMYISPFVYNDIYFKSSEHFYQASRTLDKREQNLIISSSTPYIAKKRSHEVTTRKDWDDIKIKIMYSALFLKFTNNEKIKYLLVESDDYIQELNNWHDNFYGNCTCLKCKNKEGKNILGKLLMLLRNRLRN